MLKRRMYFFFSQLPLPKALIARINYYMVMAFEKKICKKVLYNLPPNKICPRFASPFKERYSYRLVR